MIRIVNSPSPFPNVFDELWQLMFHNFPEDHKPPMDVSFTGDEPDGDEIKNPAMVIQMALAGFKKGDIKISKKNRALIISGDNSKNKKVPKKFKTKFERTFSCKETVDMDAISVSFEDAILTVTLPFIQPKEDSVSIWP